MITSRIKNLAPHTHPDLAPDVQKSFQKSYSCKLCPRLFEYFTTQDDPKDLQINLKVGTECKYLEHKCIHTGEKPYVSTNEENIYQIKDIQL